MPTVIVRTHSFSSDALDPKVKHFSRMNFNLAELEAGDVDPEGWPILTDGRGHITEGVGYNVFIVTDGVIRTAGDRGVLQGVSRAMVFDLARELGIPIVEKDLQPYDVYTADEAFFTSTSPCVLPVTRVDRRPIGAGAPRPGRPAAPRHVERNRRRGHRGAGRALGAARTARVQGRLLVRTIRERARVRGPSRGRCLPSPPFSSWAMSNSAFHRGLGGSGDATRKEEFPVS